MKTLNVCMIVLAALQGLALAVLAQDLPASSAVSRHVSDEFKPFVGSGTNSAVIAREVTWTGKPWRKLVLYSKDSREAVVASSTNQVCSLRGKLFTVHPSVQSFWIVPSVPLGTNEFTREAAIHLAEESIQTTGFGPGAKQIDLAKYLEKERDRRLAQMLILRNVAIAAERGQLVVSFESYTGFRGTATLNESLELISAEAKEPVQE
jgi:hypothetical protein